jgi:hypothetical protein
MDKIKFLFIIFTAAFWNQMLLHLIDLEKFKLFKSFQGRIINLLCIMCTILVIWNILWKYSYVYSNIWRNSCCHWQVIFSENVATEKPIQ